MKVHEIVTQQIIERLEKGVIPWKQGHSCQAPFNHVTKRHYNGINFVLLLLTGGKQPSWMTFHQIHDLGLMPMKGSKGQIVVFFKQLEVKDERTESGKNFIPMARYYHLFNAGDVDGLNLPAPVKKLAAPQELFHQMKEKLCPITEGNFMTPCFRPNLETRNGEIEIPAAFRFKSEERFWATLFHEIIHSTKFTMNRIISQEQKTETEKKDAYAFEELVAELGASMLCVKAGIANDTLDNAAAYIDGWKKYLTNDPHAIMRAAAAAQKAVDYLLPEVATVHPLQEQAA